MDTQKQNEENVNEVNEVNEIKHYTEEQLNLVIKILSKIKHLEKDDKGYYFWGGAIKGNQLECDENREILEDNDKRMMKLFKQHNWSNMRKGKNVVGNHLRFLLCKLTNQKAYNCKVVRAEKSTARKYYLPNFIQLTI